MIKAWTLDEVKALLKVVQKKDYRSCPRAPWLTRSWLSC
jgi:hypothetical protein